MKLLGHCFRKDGGLDIEFEASNGRRGKIDIQPDAVRRGVHAFVPLLLAGLEQARRVYELGAPAEALPEQPFLKEEKKP